VSSEPSQKWIYSDVFVNIISASQRVGGLYKSSADVCLQHGLHVTKPADAADAAAAADDAGK